MESNESKKNSVISQSRKQFYLSLIKADSEKSCNLSPDEKAKHEATIKLLIETASEIESDTDDTSTTNDSSAIGRPIGPLSKYDPTIDDRLPDTVTLLTTPEGNKVYLVGTAHFSEESNNDVSMIVQAVQPHIVMLELCAARVYILKLDEETVLREAENLNMQKMKTMIKENGLFNGLVYILLLNMSAQITKQLGIAPGGEFRRAFIEAKKIPRCIVHLGDRPINITLKRALHSLSWWQSITLFWNLMYIRGPITKEDVERCKHRDMLEELLAEMTSQFPSLGEAFVNERDLYLTHSLQLAAKRFQTPEGIVPARVVGVVGIGHMPGIIKRWGKIDPSDIAPLMIIPPTSLSVKIIRFTLKASLISAIIYAGYKLIPLPSVSTFQSLKSSVEGLLKVSDNR